ncbi:MAG: IS607 family transposase [Desulfobacterales bacterium]|nr:IS607 family transposase [Desulfobacterales bacterium]MBF0396421.1 IS607 family transposase [Desulfobacterales bacterium]
MNRFIKVGEAAQTLGVSIQTLRRWEESKQLVPDKKTKGGTRYYDKNKLLGFKKQESEVTIGYARVSSHDQKKDLQTQKEMLEAFCISNGWTYEIIDDLGSGMNYNKKGLKRLIDLILDYKITRLVLTHKDRLLRFGAELIFTLCELRQVEVVIINKSEDTSFEEELASDVLEIITVFSARLYGSRSHKNKKLKECLSEFTNGNNAKSQNKIRPQKKAN